MSKLQIANHGTACLPIVVGTDAPQEIKTAARDLSHILWRMTGAKFEITESSEGASVHFVIDEHLEEEQFVIGFVTEVKVEPETNIQSIKVNYGEDKKILQKSY